MKLMEHRNLRSFVATAETLNFRGAAKKLNISQPALTKQIQQLEDEIGVPLFKRGRPHVTMTSAGAMFLERAREILRASSAAIIEARQVQAGLNSPVTIGFVSQAAFRALPALLEQFRQLLPEGDFRLKELSASRQMSALRSRRIDIALVQTTSQPPEFQSVVFTRERFAIVLSTRHRLARVPTATLRDFREDMVFLPEQDDCPGTREIILANFARHGGTPARFQEIERVQTAICLASANLGVALVPESAKLMRMQGVQFRTLRRPAIPIETLVVWRRQEKAPVLQLLKSGMQSDA